MSITLSVISLANTFILLWAVQSVRSLKMAGKIFEKHLYTRTLHPKLGLGNSE